jgi:site-specific DNA-methyltransferase (adenine-specific)
MKNRGVDGELSYRKTKRNEFTKVRNVFTYSIGGGISTKDKCAYGHPAIMPESLAHDQIITWSNHGDLVYDPFTGSGTTAKMALSNGRRFVGSEIFSDYCDLVRERLTENGLLKE